MSASSVVSNTLGPATTIEALLEEGLNLSRGGVALYLNSGNELHHRGLHHLLERAEQDLRTLGISRQTRIMTALPDGPLAACVLLALTRSAICAPINPDLRDAELEILIPELGVEMLVAHGSCADEVRRVAKTLGLPIVEVEFDGAALRWTGSPLSGGPIIERKAKLDDLSLVLLTSGSSARPKRVPLTHRQLTLAARRMTASLKLSPDDCCLNMMPMFHVGAVVDLLLAPLSVGGSLMRPEAMSSPAFFEAVASGIPTWFQGVPTLLHELAAHGLRRQGSYPQNSLRLIRSVSSPLPPEWYGEIEAALGAPVIEIYGMTETAGIITSNPLPPAMRKIGSVGLPTGLETVIRDADGNPAGENVRGEILVRGAGIMTGYEKMEGADRGFTLDGWLKTGDEGFLDEDGYLFITGRIGDQINRGGEKISPREVDEILVSHPAVKEAAAFPIPHPHLGQEVAAALVLESGAEVTAENLLAHVASHLAHFKVPKTIFVVEHLPRGPGGKLRRRLLPDMVQSLAPLASGDAEKSEEPRTPMEQKVAAWWQNELGVSSIARQGDFFELGGDSLMAASFTMGIEKTLGITVRPAALFDHPTVAAFASYLEQATAQPGRELVATEHTDSPVLNADFHRRLLAAMSVWPGARRSDSSLLVGLRTSGKGIPIFWCGQGRGEFDNLVDQLPPEHPVYGTRSLYLFPGREPKDESALALLFANEVAAIAAGREIILGGFCAGGRIVVEAATHLRAQGQPIRLIFLHEVMPDRVLDAPVALGMCRDIPCSPMNPLRRFDKPELLVKRRCTRGLKWWNLEIHHDQVYTPESVAQEVPKLRSLWENPAEFDTQPFPIQLPGAAYKARLSTGRQTRTIPPCANQAIKVKLTNLSNHTWPAGVVSGLHLGHRWIDAEGKPIGVPGTSVPLPREVSAGSSISMAVHVTAPSQTGQHRVEIDLVDEGVAWFSEKKSRSPSLSLKLTIHVGSRTLFGLLRKRS